MYILDRKFLRILNFILVINYFENFCDASNELLPNAYEIYITPNLEESAFFGSVSINATVILDTHIIQLDAFGISIMPTKIFVNDIETNITSFTCQDTEKKCTIYFERKLYRSDKIFISSLNFNGKLQNNMVGLYKSFYRDNNDNLR